MSGLEIFFIAVGLAMDAFAAAITSGMTIHHIQVSGGAHSRRSELLQWLIVALCFGFFQAAMPVAGWYLGSIAKAWIEPIDHWIAFTLLTLVGGHMAWEAWRNGGDDAEKDPRSPTSPRMLLIIGTATSIDALAVGVSIAALGVDIWHPAAVIGVVTAVLSFAGTWIGDTMGHLFERKLEFLGAGILIFIGLKILLQHLCF
ncbi:MAG: manganese efflux pump MntP family protein [Lentisphaeria bacterium]|nr:manganese efflux pump MntP family protein [Lentisphaeria bacterium]